MMQSKRFIESKYSRVTKALICVIISILFYSCKPSKAELKDFENTNVKQLEKLTSRIVNKEDIYTVFLAYYKYNTDQAKPGSDSTDIINQKNTIFVKTMEDVIGRKFKGTGVMAVSGEVLKWLIENKIATEEELEKELSKYYVD